MCSAININITILSYTFSKATLETTLSSNKSLLAGETVHEWLDKLCCGKVKNKSESNGYRQSRQCFLIDG